MAAWRRESLDGPRGLGSRAQYEQRPRNERLHLRHVCGLMKGPVEGWRPRQTMVSSNVIDGCCQLRDPRRAIFLSDPRNCSTNSPMWVCARFRRWSLEAQIEKKEIPCS